MADNRNTFMLVPRDVTNALELHRFLSKLVEELDVAFGLRSDNPFASSVTVTKSLVTIVDLEARVSLDETEIVQLDTRIALNEAGVLALGNHATLTETDVTNLQNNLGQLAIQDLNLPSLTINTTYTQAQVQELSNQVQVLETHINSILARLRLSNIIQS